MNRIKSGVYGLNSLLDGGIVANSSTVVIGTAGAGKTTFALQYIMRGMETGEDGVFISLDENQQQILREAEDMGFKNIRNFIERGKLVFIDASGEQFGAFIKQELPSFVDKWEGVKSRIVIDPLTPVLWALPEKYEQREVISFLIKELRKVGTVLCTLEEHSSYGGVYGAETEIPMYLADSVIHLDYNVTGEDVERKLRVLKCRSSRHSEKAVDYQIIGGLGVILHHDIPHPGKKMEIDEETRSVLEEKFSGLPISVRNRVSNVFGNLEESELPKDDLIRLAADIVEEYKHIEAPAKKRPTKKTKKKGTKAKEGGDDE